MTPPPSWPDLARALARRPLGRRVRVVARRGRALLLRARDRLDPVETAGLDPVLGVLAATARGSGGPATLTAIALRTRSRDLVTVLEHVGRSTDKVRWTLGAATARAGSADGASRQQALETMLAVLRAHGPHPFEARQQLVLAQLLYLAGRDEELLATLPRLERITPDDRETLLTDLVHPYRGAPEAWRGAASPGGDVWARRFAGPWRAAGLAMPTVDPAAEGHLFDTLRASAPPAGTPVSSPSRLVTVVVPAFRPDEGLLTAVRSLCAQSWPAVEVLLVDDGSGPDSAGLFERAAQLDPRVRVLTREPNAGSYAARNAALAQAYGEFVTFHDADDWAHPQRLERQLAPLLADPAVPASDSLAMRAFDDLTRQWLGYPAVRVNASSLLVRTELLERTGVFDPVRKSGDSELLARLSAVTGRAPVTVQEVLAVTRLRPTSLSRGDFSMGWAASPRIAYQGAYRHWHRRLAAGTASVAALSADPRAPRPFAAPRGYHAERPTGPERCDVLLVADLCEPEAAGLPLVALLEAAHRVGVRTALLHREDPTRMRRARVHTHGAVQDLLDRGDAVQVHPDDAVDARLVCVLGAWTVAVDREPPGRLSAGRIWVPREGNRPPGAEADEALQDAWCDRLERHLAGWSGGPVPVLVEHAPDDDWTVAGWLSSVRRHLSSLAA